ncbi:hypothetical protein SYK_31170 [Pseudodesulfovibrio nedwellii]|uniref:WYL domain-containing protein n=1 Tax=Pseudodesulfovibrio nedwellii TaxID=2973072 RepID=A0ABM8B4J0_9BACT|nr:WYL domain-containing protein [Pseudodesulfovibrio nedwellii]BDQ38757.1 hypothetical protein SYK_31170 [Pseudodesulfovibrio nedwellii]
MPAKKDPYASPAEKVMGLLGLLLFTDRKYSLKQLATKFRCSKQNILRYAEQIERSHVVSLKTEMVEGERYYWSEKKPQLKSLHFTPEELQHLALCRDLVAHLMPVSIQNEIEATLLKATAFAETAILPDFGSFCGVQFKGRIDYSPFHQVIKDIVAASAAKQLCSVQYVTTRSPKAKEYLFAPVKLLAFRESLYTHGWLLREIGDLEPAHEITFAIQRIENLDVLNDAHGFTDEPPEPKGFGVIDHEDFRVKVKFDNSVAGYVQERIWSDDQSIKQYKNGNIDLEFAANSWWEVKSWVLSFGGKAKVVFPKELRSEIKEAAEAILAANS